MVVIGTLLVLGTWALLVTVWIAAGVPMSGRLTGSEASSWLPRLRRSLWWGAGFFTLAVLVAGIFMPLRSTPALLIVVVFLMPFVVFGIRSLACVRHRWPSKSPRFIFPLVIAGLVALTYLAWAALGPVTNYDTGLYHLGAISYAGDYAIVPGLANLYIPFGYNTAQFPLAAFLGNGAWQGQGFRLLNGLLLFAMVIDLALRHRSRSLGTYVLAVGVAVSLVPMVALDDYWMSSPSSDPAVMFLSFLAAAYLADGLTRRRGGAADLAVASVLAALTVTLRPLMGVFAIGVFVIVLVAERTPQRRLPAEGWFLVVGMAGALGVVQSIRDYFLSGWLQFPLSAFAFDVPWRAPDPVGIRTATLGAARDPADLWNAAQSWEWIGPWIQRLPDQWEPFLLALLLVLALVLALPVRSHLRWRTLIVIAAPFIMVDIVWFVFSPPSFRFAWGPIFALGIIPLAMAVQKWARPGAGLRLPKLASWGFRGAAVMVVAVTVVTAVWRSDSQTRTDVIAWQVGPVSVALPATPLKRPAVREETLASGLTVLLPVETDQCWAAYPMCTAQTSQNLRMRGSEIGQGFSDGGATRAASAASPQP